MKSVQIRSFFWSVFSRIQTEYGEIRSVSPYSVRMLENTDQKKLNIWTLFTQWYLQMKIKIETKIPLGPNNPHRNLCHEWFKTCSTFILLTNAHVFTCDGRTLCKMLLFESSKEFFLGKLLIMDVPQQIIK